MKNELKPIEIGYGDNKFVFYLRAISVAQEDELTDKFNEVSDDFDKYQKEFELCRSALGEFSVKMPDKVFKEKGGTVKIPLDDKENISDAVNSFFGERTIENERIIRNAFAAFRSLQQPTVSFL